ncbi:LysR substrate-binding domain-containing protein [Candidatus Corynebacterium faecigallinarum]|uniref:LysR substrate-binding domain-containing protein n=1 Tax=Candidatus Corynebacterium faecigallinarum TaxID=2838528 RepID=UPI003FD37491
MDLTPAGEAFLPSAQACLDAANRARADAVATTGELCGTLTVGAIPTVSGVDIPVALGRLRTDHPQVKLSLRVGNSNEFMEHIVAERLDVAVLPASHRLAHRKRLRLQDLTEDDFVVFPEGGSGRQQSDFAFRTAGLSREVAFETATIDLMVGLVRQGLVVALRAPSVVDGETGVSTVDVTDGHERVIYLAWSRFNPSPSALALLEILQKSADENGAD